MFIIYMYVKFLLIINILVVYGSCVCMLYCRDKVIKLCECIGFG